MIFGMLQRRFVLNTSVIHKPHGTKWSHMAKVENPQARFRVWWLLREFQQKML